MTCGPTGGTRAWQSFDNAVTRFANRNFVGMQADQWVTTMDGRKIPMSEYGVFSNREKDTDRLFFLVTAAVSVFDLAKASTVLSVVSGSNTIGSLKTYNGVDVLQHNKLINPNLVDDLGRTNLQRMQSGLAPLGSDGKALNLHHVDQTMNGIVEEMTATAHQQNYGILHSNTGQSASQIDRSAFDKWRSSYWKERAHDF